MRVNTIDKVVFTNDKESLEVVTVGHVDDLLFLSSDLNKVVSVFKQIFKISREKTKFSNMQG